MEIVDNTQHSTDLGGSQIDINHDVNSNITGTSEIIFAFDVFEVKFINLYLVNFFNNIYLHEYIYTHIWNLISVHNFIIVT